MAGKSLLDTLFPRRLSMRERILALLVLLALFGGLTYQYPYGALEQKVLATKANQAALEKALPGLAAEIADLKAHEEEIRAGAKGWQLVDQKGVIMVLEDVSAEARRQGVSLLSLRPSQEVEKGDHKEVSLNIDLKGRYRELAEYFRQIENQSRLVNIRKFRVEACPDSSSACATQLEAVTYVAK
jgi:Tfp pilus assembly protein PilO